MEHIIKTIENNKKFLTMVIGLAVERIAWIIKNNPEFTKDISDKSEKQVSELLDKAGVEVRSEFLIQLPIQKKETLVEIDRIRKELGEAEEKLAIICSKLIELA